jgi:hypothetical protein
MDLELIIIVRIKTPNLNWGNWYDFLGYRVSSFTILW